MRIPTDRISDNICSARLGIAGYQTVREDPTIVELAAKYGVAPAQIILAWHIARGVGLVPSSKNPVHQMENINVSSLFSLTSCI